MAHRAAAPLPVAGATLADHLIVQSHEADKKATGSRVVASLAGAMVVVRVAVAPTQGGIGMFSDGDRRQGGAASAP